MPAALILDDEKRSMMMTVSSLPRRRAAETKPQHYGGGGITCEHSSTLSSAAFIPSDHYCTSTNNDDDGETSNVDERSSPAHDFQLVAIATNPPRNTFAVPVGNVSSLVPAALEVLNSAAAETADLLAVMRALPYDPRIQTVACEKLWVHSYEDDQALRLGLHEGGIRLVLEAMVRFPRLAPLQHSACEVLQNLAALQDDGVAQEICRRGGVQLLVRAMQNHPERDALQLCGCIALTSLAQTDSTTSRGHREHIRQVGGVDAVLYAKWNHENKRAVVLGVQLALEALGYDEVVEGMD